VRHLELCNLAFGPSVAAILIAAAIALHAERRIVLDPLVIDRVLEHNSQHFQQIVRRLRPVVHRAEQGIDVGALQVLNPAMPVFSAKAFEDISPYPFGAFF
jgi:hypothetical protein